VARVAGHLHAAAGHAGQMSLHVGAPARNDVRRWWNIGRHLDRSLAPSRDPRLANAPAAVRRIWAAARRTCAAAPRRRGARQRTPILPLARCRR
jgi:hypothetical protein